jgi:hypothetical protein
MAMALFAELVSCNLKPSVTDPDPNLDPCMFLGLLDPVPDTLVSGSFYHQAKIVRKTLIPAVL